MEEVEFLSSGNKIKGYFFPSPGDKPIASIVFLQGFPGIDGDELICSGLAQENINVLTFNYRGTFQSEGLFSFENAMADIGAALQFLKEPHFQKTYRIDPENIHLGGWSFGSGLVLVGAMDHKEIKKIFRIAGSDFGKEARKIADDPDYAVEVRKNLERVRYPDGPVKFKGDLVRNLINNQAIFDMDKLIPNLKDRDILLLGGWDDQVALVEDNLIPLYRTLANQGINVTIEALQDGYSFDNSKNRLIQIIVNWLNQ
jgi:dienelactone hydrolase